MQSGSPAQSAYVSSKGGLMGMTKALALEFAASGATFNMIPPGAIDTPMLCAQVPLDMDKYAKTLPMKRLGQPEDIAAAAAYLASEEAGYITGHTAAHGEDQEYSGILRTAGFPTLASRRAGRLAQTAAARRFARIS